ncbi:MAG: response regulator [bacterium]|nr:response regulator [bacterium]
MNEAAANETRIRALVIDDEAVIGLSCRRILSASGCEVETRSNPHEGQREALTGRYDLILLDVRMPDLDGVEILRAIKEAGVQSDVIIITGYSSVESAVDVMKLGAADYVCKPFSPDELRLVVDKVMQGSPVIRRNLALRRGVEINQGFEGMIGQSPAMTRVFGLIQRVAPTDSVVLITGESGVGKELAARAIHRLSKRRDKAFIACDCSALAPTLLESELFGHVKGSFSGAVATKKGLFEVAGGGTLFLDELSNLSLETQGKLLRVLETRRIKRVGDAEERDVDIRLVGAANRDLRRMVQDGEFRQDLFFRLNVVPIHLPALRERIDDLPILMMAFLDRLRKDNPSAPVSFSPEALRLMRSYAWPGNVRELRNIVERIAILCDSERIEPQHLPDELRGAPGWTTAETPPVPQDWDAFKDFKKAVRDATTQELERRFLEDALVRTGGNVSRAAELVGMQRTNFHALMSKHGVKAEDFIE